MAPAQVPPIPRQTHRESRRRSIDPSMHLRLDRTSNTHDSPSNRVNVPPASPEVISSLITSLAVISKPANQHFDNPSLSVPSSPGQGSFGVEYGAYSTSHGLTGLKEEEDVDLDELAASPPTIRTSKPPSGYSPLTAPKSPRSPRRESSGGLRSFLRTSRPSSKGSAASSSHDDTRSIGALSIERGPPPTHDLRSKGSHDSWGKKARSQKGVMYMSSKERLRQSAGSVGGSASNSMTAATTKPESLLAEITINEEPSSELAKEIMAAWSPASDPGGFSGSIPARESSLRKTGSNAKRSSYLSSAARRRSEGGAGGQTESIRENNDAEEEASVASVPKRRQPIRHHSEADTKKRREDILNADLPPEVPAKDYVGTKSLKESSLTYDKFSKANGDGGEEGEGAPFPSVYSSRRRSAQSTPDRRKSGRMTPDPVEVIRHKRSSSRLKRLSAGAKSPEPGDRVISPTPEPTVGYERPPSADSIDDAVESYLRSSRLSQKIRHPQTGRVISFSEVGDPDGSAVFCCVGMGLTRYIMAFYDELAQTLKLRLITPDRPGVGDSEAYVDGTTTPLSWPDDVYAICQSLKITKFSILAHSAGAIYALATALRMPQHIRGRIHLLAPWIPPSQMNTFGGSQASPPTNAIPTSQKILRALPTPFLKAANSSFMSATSSSITSSLPKNSPRRSKRKSGANNAARDSQQATKNAAAMDKENITEPHSNGLTRIKSSNAVDGPGGEKVDNELDPEAAIIAAADAAIAEKERQTTYDTRLTHAIWDLATTGANPAVDLLVCLERRHTIGFRYVDITRPVVIHHGSRDTRVPVDNVRWLGKTMRRCEVRVLEGEGHGLMASATVMGSVLMEISKEWEDWMRVTGNSKREEKERGRSKTAGIR